MTETTVIDLVQNTTMLLVFAMLYENLWLKNEASEKIWPKIITGMVLGGIGIFLMLTPWTFAPGVIFDARSILLSISGLFLGFIPTIIAMLITGSFRVMLGGDGMWVGLIIIISSGTIGLIWRQFRTSWQEKNIYIEFLVMGFIVYIVMLGSLVLLPIKGILTQLNPIVLPLMLIYPIGTVLLGMLLVFRQRNYHQKQLIQLHQAEELQRTEEELIKAKGKAEESDLLKTAFLNNISHEIRTPFNSILGFLSLIQDDDLTNSERDKYICIINKSAARVMNVINDIIEISQIQTGQANLTVSETNIKKLTGELTDRFKTVVESQKLEFRIDNDLPKKMECLSTDVIKLETILSNLINNAMKYTKEGSIVLGIHKNEQFLEFSVKDTGIGISENQKQVIFERFMQADGTRIRQFEGLGLGLSITKSYVEMLGGKIWFESEEGKGSTFYFTIPINNKRSKIKVSEVCPN